MAKFKDKSPELLKPILKSNRIELSYKEVKVVAPDFWLSERSMRL